MYYTCPAALATYSLDKDGNVKIYNSTISYYSGLLGRNQYCPSRHQIPTTIEEYLDYSNFPSATDSDIDENGDCIEKCPEPTLTNRQARANNPACTCPVKPLKPITDPEALRFENGDNLREDLLAPSMKTKLACLKDAVTKAGGTLTPKSAWRPIGYQEHFYEIFTKFKELNKTKNKKIAACKPILKTITYEKDIKHGIQGAVAIPSKSLHEDGLAFDATWDKISDAKIDQLAATCGLNRPLKVKDRVHFQ